MSATGTLDERAIDLEALRRVEERVLWLAAACVHHANAVRPNASGIKVGGHQGSSASPRARPAAAVHPGDELEPRAQRLRDPGLALEKITGEPLEVALRRMVLAPLGLDHTVAAQTATIPQPALHAFSSERRQVLGIKPSTPFLEESTFWNPSWTLARGRCRRRLSGI